MVPKYMTSPIGPRARKEKTPQNSTLIPAQNVPCPAPHRSDLPSIFGCRVKFDSKLLILLGK